VKKYLDIKVKAFIFTSKYLAGPEDNMVNPRKTQALQPWADDGPEFSWDNDVDDDTLLLDDFDEDDIATDDEIVAECGRADQLSSLAPWRRIEIAREDKYLQSLLADFDQYDNFEYFGDDLPSGYSH
jgi:hypothetical protein